MYNSQFIGAYSRKLQRQMGSYTFVRFCRNIGMTFEETYFELFGRLP
jgi:hypothetical protein